MEVQKQKVLEALDNKNCTYFYETEQADFSKIPGSAIAYWLSNTMFNIFNTSKTLADVAKPRQGLATSDNDRFLKMWYEVPLWKIGFNITSIDDNIERQYSI